MKYLIQILYLAVICAIASQTVVCGIPVDSKEDEISASFGFKQDNGYQRIEEIKYNKTPNHASDGKPDPISEKPVEFKGGYSYISADGYEYTVKYKANKNGFQPYVTAHKLKPDNKKTV